MCVCVCVCVGVCECARACVYIYIYIYNYRATDNLPLFHEIEHKDISFFFYTVRIMK